MAEEIPPHVLPGHSVGRVAAPILFGPMMNWTLYGVLCVQTFVYGYNFMDDKRLLKILVYSVFILETIQTALTGADVYYWFAAGFGDLEGLKKSRFSPVDVPIMDAFISLIVQVFFCYRIWTLSKRLWWFCIVIVILSLTQATGALWGGLKSASLGKYAYGVKPNLYIWLITSAVVDILIAVTMAFLVRNFVLPVSQNVDRSSTCHPSQLGRRRRDNENRSFRNVFPRIVRLTVETNTLTAAVAIISFVLYLCFPNDVYYAWPTGVIGKLYSNTLLVALNNRIYFRDHPSTEALSGIGPSSYSSNTLPQVKRPRIAITNATITLNSFPSTTDLDLEKAKNNDTFAASKLRPSF